MKASLDPTCIVVTRSVRPDWRLCDVEPASTPIIFFATFYSKSAWRRRQGASARYCEKVLVLGAEVKHLSAALGLFIRRGLQQVAAGCLAAYVQHFKA